MNNHFLGFLICSGIIVFGVMYRLSEWRRAKRPRPSTDDPN